MEVLAARLSTPDQLAEYRKQVLLRREKIKFQLSVCGGTGCSGGGSKLIRDRLREYLEQQGLSETVALKFTGCLGLCEQGPLVIVSPGEYFYHRVSESDIPEIIGQTILRGELVERLLYIDPASGERIASAHEIPFLKKQSRILLGDNWRIDPAAIDDYLVLGGYESLVKALVSLSSNAVIEQIKHSRLRGRGGAGFPTGVKWEECRRAAGTDKYIICNADEGDPGAFMDRSLLEGNPHLVLEGLIIGGYAVGAGEGVVFVRSEYPTAVNNIKQAIVMAESLGLLGENILGSGFNFRVRVSVGAGAFVSGETSALIRSVEGFVGEPRQKPPHLAERGLNNKPTVVNNVETLANVPYLIRFGADSYRERGTEKSKGTKIFSLVGKVNNTGLVEVPLGITLRDIIFEIGGGIRGRKKFKAVQTGGPSGGCLPEQLLDLPTDFEELSEAGSMMGSGGMIVMDEETCMVDLARYFLAFLKDESCGNCFSCREGISRLLEMVEQISRGESSLEQLSLLQELAAVVKDASLCGLGQTAPNPVLSAIRYFHEEYLAHIVERRCPAGVCRALVSYSINDQLCTGCGACLKSCPSEAVSGEKKLPHHISTEKCTKCGICLETCRFGAVMKQ
ncbi:MAG: NADH-ubiquinone oxidoreductase-F iron-sulfur binding region domain-containing protein [Bacillota bacterium]